MLGTKSSFLLIASCGDYWFVIMATKNEPLQILPDFATRHVLDGDINSEHDFSTAYIGKNFNAEFLGKFRHTPVACKSYLGH